MFAELTGISGTVLLEGFMHVGIAIFVVALGGKYFIRARRAYLAITPEDSNTIELQKWTGLSLMALSIFLFSLMGTDVQTTLREWLGSDFPLIQALSVLCFGIGGPALYVPSQLSMFAARRRLKRQNKVASVALRPRGKRSVRNTPTTVTEMAELVGQ